MAVKEPGAAAVNSLIRLWPTLGVNVFSGNMFKFCMILHGRVNFMLLRNMFLEAGAGGDQEVYDINFTLTTRKIKLTV